MNHETQSASLRATLRPLLPVLAAGLLAGIAWGVVWPFMRSAGVVELYDGQAWLAAAVAFVFISIALGDLVGSLIPPDTPARMDEDDLYEFREQAGIRRAFAFLWGSIGLTLVAVLAFSPQYGTGNEASVNFVNALLLNSTFAIGYLQKKLDEYWKAEHAKTMQTAFAIAVALLGFWSVWSEAGKFAEPEPVGVLAVLGLSYLVAWGAMAWYRNRPEVEGYAPGH